MGGSRRTNWVAAIVCMAAFSALVQHFAYTCDDAYITFRYAKNLASGTGLIFNPGESPPVEGYSNFLWTVLLAGFYAAGARGEALATVANVLSIASAVALLWLYARLVRRRLELDTVGTMVAALFLGTLAPFALWSTGGLETMPFALALFATYERLLGDPERPRGVQAGLCAAAACLLRADGALWVAVVLGLAGLSWLARRRADLLRAALTAGALLAVAVGAHVLWRHSYYGEWLPNTARVKAGFSELRLERGLGYMASLLLAVPALVLLPLAALALRGRPAPALVFQSLGVIAFAVAYALYVGGDFMPMGRFLLPAVPFVALCFAAVLRALADRGRAPSLGFAAAVIVVGLLLGLNVVRWPQELLQRFHFRWNSQTARSEYEQWQFQREQAETWVLIGQALALYTHPGESIVRGPIGAFGYFTELHVYDLNGLVTLAVSERDAPLSRASPGHDKHVDPSFFFPMRPTYLAASLAPWDSPLAASNPGLVRQIREGRIVVERRSLSVDQGFPPGLELRLFRPAWAE